MKRSDFHLPLVAPGGSLINIIPALRHIPKWFPGAYSRKMAAKARAMTDEILRIPMDYVNRSFVSNFHTLTNGLSILKPPDFQEEGTVALSLVTIFYERKYASGASREEEDVIKNVAYMVYGSMYIFRNDEYACSATHLAGSDTASRFPSFSFWHAEQIR